MGNKINAKFIQLSSEYASTKSTLNDFDTYIRQGNGDNLPTYLLDLLRTSGLHASIISRKVSMLLGDGLSEDVSPATLEFITKCNPHESLNDVMEKCAYDLEVQGGYYLKTVYNRAEGKIVELYHMPYDKMRNGLPNENGFSDTYLYYDHNSDINGYTDISYFSKYPAFNINKKKKQQILYTKNYNPTSKWYGSPIYQPSLLDLQTYAEISNFNNSTLHNSFAPSYLIFFRGSVPSQEEQDMLVDDLVDKYSGTNNNGKPILYFLDENQEEPLIKMMDSSDIADQFETLIKSLKENIVLAHQIPRQLVGLESAGSLGNSKELMEASQIFRTDYIIPHQNILLKGFNMVMMYNGYDNISINNPNPTVMTFDMSELLLILDRDEVREIFGYEKNNIEENDK